MTRRCNSCTMAGPCGLSGSAVLDVAVSGPPAGDVNGDGSVTILDAPLVAQCVGGLTDPCAAEGDVNADGRVGIADVLIIPRFVAGLVRSL
jgi:hypothetical protein